MRTALALLCVTLFVPTRAIAERWDDAPEAWRIAWTKVQTTPVETPKHLNRLVLETSPYLKQHARNPVEWYPWGPEAFAAARALKRPIFLSIGYSTCHWCHVMERESFEDAEIAAYLNAHYIAIKVDREERPDIDDVYMSAVQLLTGRGGWPMTTLLTPDKRPFFGGTYFPPRDGARGRRRGLLSLLQEYQRRYQADPASLLKSASELSRRVAARADSRVAAQVPPPNAVARSARRLAERFDARWGGFGRAPKFPTPPQLNLLLSYASRVGDPRALEMVTYTLSQMARGGIYDHVGGGFHRYATDQRWRVPHFEKMLYDNAQLVVTYLDAAALVTDAALRARLREVARETLDYLQREMQSPEGLFYAATDADSPAPGRDHPEEGGFFTWTPPELKTALSPADAALAIQAFGVTSRGELEGRNVLYLPRALSALATQRHIKLPKLKSDLTRIKSVLYKARQERSAPLRDDKRITSWNGLALSALARGARRLGEPRYLLGARHAARALLKHLKRPGGGLARTYIAGRARHHGVLDDYAFTIQGLLDLFETDGDPQWLHEATALQSHLDAHFSATRGGYYMTSDRAETLISRDQPSYDGAEPSGNSISASNLLRLSLLTDAPALRARGERLLRAFSSRLRRGGGASAMIAALSLYHDRAREVVLVMPPLSDQSDLKRAGATQGVEMNALARVIDQEYWPHIVSVRVNTRDSNAHPISWARSKVALAGKPTAYVCYEGVCERPTTDPKQLHALLSAREPLLSTQSPAPLP